MPKRTISGPVRVLFSFYINYLTDAMRACSVESYVDDTKLFLSFATYNDDKLGQCF